MSSLLRAFVGQMFIIPSESMENTLLVGDRVVVQKITDFDRGDVVVFRDPGGWLSEPVGDPGPFDRVLEFVGVPTQSTPGHLIKRVIGLPGRHGGVLRRGRTGSPSTALPRRVRAISMSTPTTSRSTRPTSGSRSWCRRTGSS